VHSDLSVSFNKTKMAPTTVNAKDLALICNLNALMCIPFGIAVQFAPTFVFSMFSSKLELNTMGTLVGRGYGCAALGFGVISLMLKEESSINQTVARALVVSSAVFHVSEVILQVPARMEGLIDLFAYSTIIGHTIGGILCLKALYS
jgi:hypothetical protein